MARTETDERAARMRPLPEEHPRKARGGWSSDVTRATYALVGLPAWFVLSQYLFGPWDESWGVMLSTYGVVAFIAWMVGRFRRRRRAALRTRMPGEPWAWDHRWDRKGVSLSPLGRLALALEPGSYWRSMGVVLIVSLLVVGAVIAFRRWMWLPLVPLGAISTWLAWKLWRLHGAGTAHLHYANFPFHPGEPVTLRFGMSEGGATFERAAFLLRRVDESTNAPDLPPTRVTYETRDVRPPGFLPGPEQDIELVFDVPATARGTSLSSRPPSYWVLDVVANTSAGPYCESFLVPIYERPRAGDAPRD